MADAKEMRRLLDTLPANDPIKTLEELAHWHESVGVAEGFRLDARLQVLFSIDETAQASLRKVALDYLAVARPSRFQENRIWTHVYEYYRQCARAYGLCVDAVIQGVRGADSAKLLLPTLAVRAVRSVAQQVKWLHLRYGPFDPTLWRLLNGLYSFAETRGFVDTAVAAYPGGGESTPRQEYLKAVLLDMSSPDTLLPHEVEACERLITEFAASYAMDTQGGATLTHWIDLGEAMSPLRLARLPQSASGLRFFGAGGALDALRALARRTESSGQPPAAFKGLAHFGNEAAIDLMQHLVLYWSPAAPERKHPRHNVKSRLTIVHGFGAVIGTLEGAHPGADKQAENWIVENVSAGGFGAVVPQAKSDWLKIGELLAMQPDGGNNWIVGMVRRVSKTTGQESRVGIQTLSRAPLLVRFKLRGADEPAVLLPAAGLGEGEAAIAMHAGSYVPGQNLENERGGRSFVYLPQTVAEHGEDYDIVRFREMIREA
jgi:hypothetical protein